MVLQWTQSVFVQWYESDFGDGSVISSTLCFDWYHVHKSIFSLVGLDYSCRGHLVGMSPSSWKSTLKKKKIKGNVGWLTGEKKFGDKVGMECVEWPCVQISTSHTHIHVNIPTCGIFIISKSIWLHLESYNHKTSLVYLKTPHVGIVMWVWHVDSWT